MFKPMLAAKLEEKTLSKLNYPLMGSPKLDGIRAVVIDNMLYSRNLKPIPNNMTRDYFARQIYNGFDGELIMGSPTDKDCFRNTSSAVMSMEGKPDVKFYIFDDHAIMNLHPAMGFIDRYRRLQNYTDRLANQTQGRLVVVPHVELSSPSQTLEYEEKCLSEGYEGIMLRDPCGRYKHGRSTVREGGLMKLKRFMDSEAEVLGLVELMENTNEKKKDELGRSKRSSHKAGKKGKDTTGALRVRDIHTGVEFEIGTGFDDATRRRFWIIPHIVVGKVVKYKYFPTGSKDKPRFPVFLGFRHTDDM